MHPGNGATVLEKLAWLEHGSANHVDRCRRRGAGGVNNAGGVNVNRVDDEHEHGHRGRPGELPARPGLRRRRARPHTLDDDDLAVKKPLDSDS